MYYVVRFFEFWMEKSLNRIYRLNLRTKVFFFTHSRSVSFNALIKTVFAWLNKLRKISFPFKTLKKWCPKKTPSPKMCPLGQLKLLIFFYVSLGCGIILRISGTCSSCRSSIDMVDAGQSITSPKGSCHPLDRITGTHPASRVSRNLKDPRRRPRGTRQ